MGAIDVAAPSMPALAGEALVQGNGRVLGLLDSAASSQAVKVFLPDGPGRGGRPLPGWPRGGSATDGSTWSA